MFRQLVLEGVATPPSVGFPLTLAPLSPRLDACRQDLCFAVVLPYLASSNRSFARRSTTLEVVSSAVRFEESNA
jgi:hypothetical protein